jgi:hypothetical protein
MFKGYPLEKEFFLFNIRQDIGNFIEDDSPLFENFDYNNFLEDHHEQKDKVENRNHSLNREEDKTNGYKLVNRLIYKKPFNNKKILFLIKKDKYKQNQNDKFQSIDNNDNEVKKFIKFKCNNMNKEKIYRKDYYFKHFKAIFGKYIKNKLNNLKNRCFPNFVLNNFSTPDYYFIGNPKQEDNYKFLSWTIKDILIFRENKNKYNRQFNNKMLILYIEKNGNKSKDKDAYNELINYINCKVEDAFLDFYENKSEFEKICSDKDCIFFDEFFKRETGFSLLEKNGFLKVIKSNRKLGI